MTKRTFILANLMAGVGAYFIFRYLTHPMETALVWGLPLAFAGSSLFCSTFFTLICQHARRLSLRLAAIPLFLAARPRSADSGSLLYGDTSGAQMDTLGGDVWLFTMMALFVPLVLLSAVAAIAAFKGIQASRGCRPTEAV